MKNNVSPAMVAVLVVVALAVVGGLGFFLISKNAGPSIKDVEAKQGAGGAALPDGAANNGKGGGTGGKIVTPAN